MILPEGAPTARHEWEFCHIDHTSHGSSER
jgi:hypothetical protein